jgi:TonB-linked SusC/RagA family outer membrane protein
MLKIYQKFKNRRLIAPGRGKYFLIAAAALCAGSIPQNILAASATTHAEVFQGVTVKGRVTDDTNSALPGVSVVEKGTTNGTVTDANGDYSLTVSSSDAVLVFSFVGMTTHQVTVGAQSEISFQMMPDAATLGEVVVVGYGTQEKKDITGSVATVSTEEFNRGIINSPEQLLQGKVSGVNITATSGEPGAPLAILVRGPGGIRTGSTPLFVVDGMALDNTSTGGTNNPLNFLNSADIENMTVLKDASATAIYGARGANGVILITTKRGKKGAAKLNYSLDYGVGKLARALDVYSADEYLEKVAELDPAAVEDSLANTNWQNEVTRTAITQNHNLSISGGAEKFNYYVSLGMQDQEGILLNSFMKRYSGRINVSQKLFDDRVSIDVNLNAANTAHNRPPIESLIGGAITANPTYPAYDENGDPYRYASGTNPLRALELFEDFTSTNRVIGNITPSVRLFKGLEYKLNFGIDNSNSTRDIVSRPSATPAQDGRLDTYYKHNNNSLIENYLTYTYATDNHDISALLGHSFQTIFVQERNYSINKFNISEIDPRYNPGLGLDLTMANNKPGGSAYRNELQSFFGRITYQYKNRYLVTGTYRVDGSSKFGSNNKYGQFPSFSLGWRISEEPFMANTPVANLKLRAGWGRTGNQEIPGKISQSLFTAQIASSVTYPLDGGTYPAGTSYNRIQNPDIQWEVSTQSDVGLEFAFLEGALSGTVDYFHKVSEKILLNVTPSEPVVVVNEVWDNIDGLTITNKGLELALDYKQKLGSSVSLSVGGNITFINNKVEGSPFTVLASGTASGSGLTSATVNGYVNNEPIGTFFLKEFIGFDENGMSLYADTDGDGVETDKDRIAAGSALPTKMYNFYARLNYKNFDLAINFNGVSGNKVYDNTANTNFYKLKLSKGVNTTPEAMKYPEESTANAAKVSTRYLKDGSYLRLNNVTLGYNFVPASIGLDKWVTSLRLAVTGQNLFLITDYDGYDPDVNIDKQERGYVSYGIDYLSYPKARTFMFSLSVGF